MRIEVNGIGLEVSDQGSGPAVVLLHGWPDSHAMWRHQVAALTAAGYRTIAPDQRGFGASERPDAVDQYSLLYAAADVVGVLDHLGVERAHVVGHDWGAAVAWLVGTFSPDRVDHLVAMSVGHLRSFGDAGLPQREKSWYMLLFQFEGVAEEWLAANDCANFREWSQHPDADAVAAGWGEPAAITAGLNWYRANLPPSVLVDPPMELPPVTVPTMGIWSSGDMALTETQMTGSAAFVAAPWRYERIEGAGHWIPLERPDEVNALLLDFLPPPP